MKNFTAIQNTEVVKGMGYSFKAKSLDHAKEVASSLLSGDIIEVYETDDLGNRIDVSVITHLTIGGVKDYIGLTMYDNHRYNNTFNTIESFLSNFTPTILSDNLIKRIKEEWNKKDGKITFKPKGYKSNQTFYFNV